MGINNQEHEDRNSLGFEGDTIMRDKIKSIIESNGIKTVIETGTYKGATTKWFAKWAEQVHTVELDKTNFEEAFTNLASYSNIKMWFGDSSTRLFGLLGKVKEPLFIFLDAHWQENNPLLDELAAIYLCNVKPIIAIHDFKVPGTDLGFDSYNGQDYEWDWIKDSIEKIYGKDGYRIEYNSEATGARQGILYVFPKI